MVDSWKNKARRSNDEDELQRDLAVPSTSPDSNNPQISPDGHNGIAVVEFDEMIGCK